MKATRLCVVGVVLFALGSLPGCDSEPRTQIPDPSKDGNDPTKEPNRRKLSLKSAWTTTTQAGMIHADRVATGNTERALTKAVRFFPPGASNIFLVQGKTIDEALEATRFVGISGVGVPQLSGARNHSAERKYWVVVCLGIAQTTPLNWKITSATLDRNRIEVRFHRPKGILGRTDDARYYLYWIPIGTMRAGMHELILKDTEQDRAILSRAITIRAKKK